MKREKGALRRRRRRRGRVGMSMIPKRRRKKREKRRKSTRGRNLGSVQRAVALTLKQFTPVISKRNKRPRGANKHVHLFLLHS